MLIVIYYLQKVGRLMKAVTILLVALFLLVLRIERMLAFTLTYPTHTVMWPLTVMLLTSILLFTYAIYVMIKDARRKK